MVIAELELETGYIVLNCSYEEKDVAKSTGATWDKHQRRWYFPTANYSILKVLSKEPEIQLGHDLVDTWRELKYIEEYSYKIKNSQPTDLPSWNDRNVKSLYSHQKTTNLFGTTRKCFADLSDCGTGKTISTLSVIDSLVRKRKGKFLSLVIAPKSIILSSWVDDCKKAFPHLSIVPVMGTREEKLLAFDTADANILVTNYETMNQGFEFPKGLFDMLVCDEAVRLKNPQAQWTKNITELSKNIEYKIIISGLITPNNLMEVFAPFSIIEHGVLGKSFYQFRGKYFTPNPFSYMNREWVPKKNSEAKIANKIERLIIRHKKSECLDLPDKMHVLREITIGAKQMKDYKKMEKQFLLELEEGTILAVNAGAKIQKLQQIASGFIYINDGDGGRKALKLQNKKLKELKFILEGELIGEQVIVFCSYQAEISMFREIYPNESYIVGNQKTLDQTENITRFKAGESRILFANVQASKYGLTFTNCHNVIYYSLTYSLDDLYQSQERIHRIGQTKKCNYIYLIAKNTIDKKIYNAVTKKQSLNDMIYEMIEESKNGTKGKR